MKQPIIIFLLIACIFAGNSEHFTIQTNEGNLETILFRPGEVTVDFRDGYHHIKGESKGYTTVPGYPRLPVYSTLYQVDPGKVYTARIRVLSSRFISDLTPYPTQALHLSREEKEMAVEKDHLFYASDGIYPAENVRLSDIQFMRDLALITISVTPFRYDNGNHTLEIFEEVEIIIQSQPDPDGERVLRAAPASVTFNRFFEKNVLNFENSREVEDTPSILYICGGNSLNSPYFQALLNWRHQRGYIVNAVPLSVTGSGTGDIKNYIQDQYDNSANPPDFVCLVGDAGGSYNVPTFTEYYSGYYGEGDHPYSQLSGDDILPDVFLGRLSVRSSSDIAVVVNKIINYEKGIDLGNNWTEKAALIGDPGQSGISTVITNQSIGELMTQYGMEDIRHKYSGGSWSTWMESQLNEGVLYFNYRGYYGVSGFSSGNIDNANNGYKLPFATVITCGTGSFATDNTALSEKFLRAGTVSNPRGGVASIGTATLGTHTLFNNIFDMGVYYGLFVNENETAGEALSSGKFYLFQTYPDDPENYVSIFTHWNNLMGDPATHLWTDTPKQFDVTHPESLNPGENVLMVNVNDENGEPVENARVTLLKGQDEIFINAFTDMTGEVWIPLDNVSSGEITLTVTKRNFVPSIAAVHISATAPEIDLLSDDMQVTDDGSGGSAGNGDLTVNPGEVIFLTVPLRNSGSQTLTDLTGTLTSSGYPVTIVDGNSSIGELASGSVMTGEFLFQVLPSAIGGDLAELLLTLESSEGDSWSYSIPISIEGPFLTIASVSVNGGSDIWQLPGDTAQVAIRLRNEGSYPIQNITGDVTFPDGYFQWVEGSLFWQEILPGETVLSTGITVVKDGDIISGSVFSPVLQLVSESGYDRMESFTFQVGDITVTDPLGPDEYGYYIYDSGDTGYSLAPEYDWIEIDPDYGGPGQVLSIEDSGDNGDESVVINLPFNFRFYGQDYSQLTVCSNGWIAPGSTPLRSFRNYAIPGPGGPAPMIAAFWDDLITTGSGKVVQYHDESEGRFIIQWSDVQTYNHNSPESFQVILYDQMVPPFGDGEIKIQYKTFNNTSNGSYNTWGTPIHGGYSTIGIENASSDVGLQYTFNNEYPEAAMPLLHETAIFITTRAAQVLPEPVLTFDFEELALTLQPGELFQTGINITNSGEEGSILYFSLEVLPLAVPGGPPDDFGYYWSDSDMDAGTDFRWVDISGMGESVQFDHNDQATDTISIGFDFPFYGETYSHCIISPNGWIGFGEDNTAWNNGAIPSPDSPRPAILPFWDDLNPVNAGNSPQMEGNVWFYGDEDKFVVWFDHVAHWSGEIDGNYNFQAVLFANGDVDFNYDTLEGTINRQTVGIQNAGGTDGLQIVMDDTYIHQQLTTFFRVAPTWLTIDSENSLSDELQAGETAGISLSVDAEGMLPGEYEGLIKLTSNVQPPVLFPVYLTVSDIPGVTGDLDQDGQVNVIDIVILVNIIIGQIEPDEYQMNAGDLNNDGLLDVLDIVQMVDWILNQ